jgi:hypothetical protein
MFSKKSNLTKQVILKEELLKDVNGVLYKFERGQFNKGLNPESTHAIIKEIRATFNRLENSIGTGDEDLNYASKKVSDSLENLSKASRDNLDGRFEDCALSLIDAMEEIIDMENGLISQITLEENPSKKKKTFIRKLNEIEKFEQEFVKNRNRIENEITKIERDKKELDVKLLKSNNPRVKQSTFIQIKATLNKLDTLKLKSNEYSSCYHLLESIKVFAKELVELGDISEGELDKAKIVLNINRIRFVLNEPKKLETLLKVIEHDLKNSAKNTKLRVQGISTPIIEQEDYEDMNNYEKQLIQKEMDKEEISGDVDDLQEYLNSLKVDQ